MALFRAATQVSLGLRMSGTESRWRPWRGDPGEGTLGRGAWFAAARASENQAASSRADLRMTVEERFRDDSGDPETETRYNSETQREKEIQRGAPGKARDRDTEG